MKNYMKRSKIYRNFPLEYIRSHLLGNTLIGYDKNNDEIIVDDSLLIHFRMAILTIYLISISYDGIYYLLIRDDIDIVNVNFVLLMLFTIIASIKYWLNAKNLQRSFCDMIYYLEVIDDLLSRYYVFSKTKRMVNYGNLTLTVVFVAPSLILFVPCSIMHYVHPEYIAINLTILAIYFNIFTAYIIICKLLLNDRLFIFNEVILKFRDGSDVRSHTLCAKCNGIRTKSKDLCNRHTIL